MKMLQVLQRSLVLGTFMALLVACGGEASESSSTSGDGEFLFSDEFSSESTASWLLEGDELGSTTIQDGRLTIDVSQPNSLQYSMLREPSFSDFDVVVEAELMAGERDATYGLLFRMAGPEEFYRFELTGDGRYIIERHDADGTWNRLVDGWQRSELITTGLGAMNQLRVTAVGPAMTFHVNDSLLAEIQDGRYVAGNLALDAGTFSNQRTIAAFDNLFVREP